jgi:imidazolonepropionase-like amidohydrolase
MPIRNSLAFGRLIIAALAAAFSCSAIASQAIVLKAASYVDTQQGKLIRPAVIVIEQNLITAINPRALRLIDVHTHLMIGTNDTAELIRQAGSYSETDFVLAAMGNGYKTLMAGFTTVRDLDSWYFVDVTLSKISEREEFSLPRIIPAGHGINMSSPADYSHIFPPVESLPNVGIADSKAELIAAVDHQAAMGVGVIKLYGTAGFTMSAHSDKPVGPQTYSDEEVAAVVIQAKKHGLKVATHAHGSEGIMASVKGGVASIEHGSLLTEEIIAQMNRRGTYLVPTTPVMNKASLQDPHLPAKGLAVVKQGIQSHQRAIKAGVNIAYGTDAGLYPHGRNADGFVDLVEYGMSAAQAITTATVNAARLLGVDDRGAIVVGKLADIIAVNGNPLEDVSLLQNVSFVMKNGRIYKLDAKSRLLPPGRGSENVKNNYKR